MEEIPYCRGVLGYKLSLDTSQVIMLSHNNPFGPVPPAGPSASLTIGNCIHQHSYLHLDLHLPMLENWSPKSGASSERAAVTKSTQVSTESPASGCSSDLWHCLSLPKLNYLSAVKPGYLIFVTNRYL